MRKRSVFSAAAIVAGNGIGSGVMAIPYFVSKAGVAGGVFSFLLAYLISVLLHLMIAQILLHTGDTADILRAFHVYLFKGRFRNALKIAFFIILVVVLETNLAAYISGAAEIVSTLFPAVPAFIFQVLFYILAAIIVVLGLHAICISEKITVSVMGGILLVALIFSFLHINTEASGTFLLTGGFSCFPPFLAAYSMIMFSFSAIFAVPQVIDVLDRDEGKIRKAIFFGLLMNLIISVIVTVCAILTSAEVTKVAVVGWAKAVGGIIQILGSIFILLAMFTSYWSIGFATTKIISNQTKWPFALSFALATVPALIITFVVPGGFMEYMKIAGGAVAVIISLMLIPTYLICTKENKVTMLKSAERSKITVAAVFLMYLVMAVGSFITV